MPRLGFPGGALVGCSAGFLNVLKIKGTHTAMKSGMLAAEAAAAGELEEGYERALRDSWVYDELYGVRNVRPAFGRFGGGLMPFFAYTGLDQVLLRGKAPWTLAHHGPDHEQWKRLDAPDAPAPIEYGKPDGVVSFDMATSLSRAGIDQSDDQPIHLTLKDDTVPVAHNLKVLGGPEQNYCPAGVYEYVENDETKQPELVRNAQNCVHCKTCDIADPTQNIVWKLPEGGPNYTYG